MLAAVVALSAPAGLAAQRPSGAAVNLLAAAPVEEQRVPEARARWRGGVLLDDTVRGALRLSSDEARLRAAVMSDWLLRILVAVPWVLDALLAATVLRRRWLLAAELFASSALTLSVTGLIQSWVSRDVGRERPYVQECARPAPPVDCSLGGAAAQVSFYSGHTATAAAGASLFWLHASYAPARLAGLKWLVRGLASLGALATGVLRILADRHYATDVIAGALAGVALALLVFRLLLLLPGATPRGRAPVRGTTGS